MVMRGVVESKHYFPETISNLLTPRVLPRVSIVQCSQSQVRTAFSRAQTETLEAQFGKQVQFCISRLPKAGLFKVGLEHENSFNVRCIWVDFLPFGFLHFPGSV